MPEENTTGTTEATPQTTTAEVPQERKVFSRQDIVRSVPIAVHLPHLFPGYDPFEFELALKLSGEAKEAREKYLALAAADQTADEDEQNLVELCDLMRGPLPKGFADLKDNGGGAGSSFKEYVQTSTGSTREILNIIVRGATNLYWRKLAPQEFRSKV